LAAVLVPGEATLAPRHRIIQVAMG